MATRALRSTAGRSTARNATRTAARNTAVRSLATLPTSQLVSSIVRDQVFQPSAQLRRNMTTNLGAKNIDLTSKIEQFKSDVQTHLPADGKGVCLASAFIVTDQIMLALMATHFPEITKGMTLIAVDTMHLFPETVDLMKATEEKYGKKMSLYKPVDCETTDDFSAKYGHCEAISHADFDFHSKVEPFQRALSESNKEILITGRRMDQGSARLEMDVWEPDKKTFNPCAGWSWEEVLAYVDQYEVPYNKKHDMVFRSASEVPATERHLDAVNWEAVNLGKPYWQCTEDELKAGANNYYVFKSFGDFHTSVPVSISESERSGRFVRYGNTECGIHTRSVIEGAPHGGNLVNLMFTGDAAAKKALIDSCDHTVELTERQACDVELMCNGGFSPLDGFMNEETYTNVVEYMRLPELELWGMPITFDTSSEDIKEGDRILLTYNGQQIATMDVDEKFKPNKVKEASECFKTTSLEHPNVLELVAERGQYYLGGPLTGLDVPNRPFPCKTPAEVREEIVANGAKNVVAFQCRNPVHRAHFELFWRVQGMLTDPTMVLVHPTCGPTQSTDIQAATRFLTYEALQGQLKEENLDSGISWAYLPYSMLLSGPREAIQHMIIRKNFGCNHFIIGRDMAGTKSTLDGEDFYGPDDAKDYGLKYQDELGVKVVPFENMVYTVEGGFMPDSEAKGKGFKPAKLSGTEFRRKLRAGEQIPEWFSFKSVIDVLESEIKKEGI